MVLTFWKPLDKRYRLTNTPTSDNAVKLGRLHDLGGKEAIHPAVSIQWFLTAMRPDHNFTDWTIIRDRPGLLRFYSDRTLPTQYLLTIDRPEKNFSDILR